MSILDDLCRILGKERVRTAPGERLAYAYDATGEKHLPDAVLFPASAPEVASCLQAAVHHKVPVVARGAGTNLSGGTLPVHGGLVFHLGRMNRIQSVDPDRRRAVVEPGVLNGALQEALRPHGLHFAPDPSSMRVSTIGGNIAENAGGPHCLKYGVTSGHVAELQVATSDGQLTDLTEFDPYDLRGLVIGSEGTLGIVTKATLKLTPLPASAATVLAVFSDLESSSRAVSAIIAAKVIPAALELMDRWSMDLARESGYDLFPEGAEAALIVEVDGCPEDLAQEAAQVEEICRRMGATGLLAAATEQDRARLWQGRRAMFGVLARLSPYIWTQDVTVPRHRLPAMLRRVLEIGQQHGLRIVTVAHAGDGNLHPTIPYDPGDPDERERVRLADLEILKACVEMGGSISGEHGIGLDKLPGMELMFTAAELDLMRRVRSAFDPTGLMNPGKLVPAPKGGF